MELGTEFEALQTGILKCHAITCNAWSRSHGLLQTLWSSHQDTSERTSWGQVNLQRRKQQYVLVETIK